MKSTSTTYTFVNINKSTHTFPAGNILEARNEEGEKKNGLMREREKERKRESKI